MIEPGHLIAHRHWAPSRKTDITADVMDRLRDWAPTNATGQQEDDDVSPEDIQKIADAVEIKLRDTIDYPLTPRSVGSALTALLKRLAGVDKTAGEVDRRTLYGQAQLRQLLVWTGAPEVEYRADGKYPPPQQPPTEPVDPPAPGQ